MAMNMGSPGGDGEEEEQEVSAINTTPLVDVMLVLLIIFLITIPVFIPTVKLQLPKEVNIATQTKPENIVLSVDKDGEMFWGQEKLRDVNDLFDRLKPVAVKEPQPEVHIRGDLDARYEPIGRIIYTLQRAGIVKVGFITEPPPHGG